MTKIIHCITVGPSYKLGDFELICMESWKKVYPDWEIRYWTDEEIKPLIQDCNYAKFCYSVKKYAFVTDYLRLKILYEYGGLYMDTDVFCVDRVPDSYFDTAFSCWDPGYGTYWSLNGICLYSNPRNKIIGEMVEFYKSFKEDSYNFRDNTSVEFVLRKNGIDFSDRLKCRFSDQKVGDDYVTYNCIEFGCWDHNFKCYNYVEGRPVYFVHCGTESWVAKKEEEHYLYYAFLNEDTDLNKLYHAVEEFIELKLPSNVKPILLIAVNCINENAEIFSKRLWMGLGANSTKKWDIFPIGNKLDDKKLYAAFLDFVTKKINKIKVCKNIMRGI